jgi:hypothetical protein
LEKKDMKLIALDISGNFKEGKGTTGICKMVDGEVIELTDIKAKEYDSAEKYWSMHEEYIQQEWPDHIVIEGYKLYNHKGMSASTQANSDLETPQLLGFLKMGCYYMGIPYTIQYAADIKTRWSEDVLVRLGILEHQVKGNKNFYYHNGKLAITHHRDALKHALHYWRYKHESK